MKLGSSQSAVLKHLRLAGPHTSQAVGRELYDTVSACATVSTPDPVKTAWAGKLLGQLYRAGKVTRRKYCGKYVYSVKND